MQKLKAFSFGLLIALAVGAFAQDSVIPSKLRLRSLGVGVAAPATAGNITASGTVSAGTVNATTAATLPTGTTINGSTACSAANGACPQTTDASLLTTGTLAAARLPAPIPIANGGTNLTTATNDATIVGNGTTWISTAIPSCSATTSALRYNTSTNAFSCDTLAVHARAGRVQIVSNVSCNVGSTQFDTSGTTPVANGTCTYTWGTAFTIAPNCVASPIIASRIAFVSATTTTSVTVNLTDLTGTLVNGSVDVHCLGF